MNISNGFLRWAVLRTIKVQFYLHNRTYLMRLELGTTQLIYSEHYIRYRPIYIFCIAKAPLVAMRTTSGARAFYIEFRFHYDSRLQSRNDLKYRAMAIRSSIYWKSLISDNVCSTSMPTFIAECAFFSHWVTSFQKQRFIILLLLYYILYR